MKKDSAKSKKITDLRERAEEILRMNTGDMQKISDKDVRSLVHELQVHQIELEMQNEELRRAQIELEESRNRYSDLYDFAPIGYFTFDKNGLILEVNLTGANKLGVERSFLIKKPFYFYIVPECKDVFYLHLRQVFKTKTQQTCQIKLIDENKNQFDARLESLAMKDSKGNFSQCRTAIIDITESKKMEELVLENERLISANRAKSEFVTIMSHELRTPLTSVIGYSIILKEMIHGKLNEKQGFFIDNILASGKHLLDVVNEILDLARIEAGKLELVIESMPLHETVSEIVNLMKERAKTRKIILKKEFDPELGDIEADRQKFKQILFNLLSNAMKFSKEDGGTITVSTKKEGDMAKISVLDTGIGIREEDISKLFHRFEQLDSGLSRKYEGAGLGLAITKQLVELHRGRMVVESRYGEGSSFTFFLPVGTKK